MTSFIKVGVNIYLYISSVFLQKNQTLQLQQSTAKGLQQLMSAVCYLNRLRRQEGVTSKMKSAVHVSFKYFK